MKIPDYVLVCMQTDRAWPPMKYAAACSVYRQKLVEMGIVEGCDIWRYFFGSINERVKCNETAMRFQVSLNGVLELSFSHYVKIPADEKMRNLEQKWITARFTGVESLDCLLTTNTMNFRDLWHVGFWHRKGVKHAFFDFSTEDGKISRVMFTFEDVEFVENASGINQ